MRVTQVSLDVVVSDGRTQEEIENGLKDLASENNYSVVDSNSTDVSDYYNSYDPSELELQQHCMTEWHEGYCEKCPHNDACNKYIMKHGTTPMDTFGE